jgi:hypothetical protein
MAGKHASGARSSKQEQHCPQALDKPRLLEVTHTPSRWFSTCLRFVVLVEGQGSLYYEDDVCLFQCNA